MLKQDHMDEAGGQHAERNKPAQKDKFIGPAPARLLETEGSRGLPGAGEGDLAFNGTVSVLQVLGMGSGEAGTATRVFSVPLTVLQGPMDFTTMKNV